MKFITFEHVMLVEDKQSETNGIIRLHDTMETTTTILVNEFTTKIRVLELSAMEQQDSRLKRAGVCTGLEINGVTYALKDSRERVVKLLSEQLGIGNEVH